MFEEIELKVRNWFLIIKNLIEMPQFEKLDNEIKAQIEKILIQMDEFINA